MNWHLALEHQMDIHKWHISPIGRSLTASFFYALTRQGAVELGKTDILGDYALRKSVYEGYTDRFIECLWRADTIYLTHDMEEVILQAAHDLPDEAVSLDDHLLLSKQGFMLLETPLVGLDAQSVETHIGAIAWAFEPDMKVVIERAGKAERVETKDICHIYFFEPQDIGTTKLLSEEFRRDGIPVPPFQLAHYYPFTRRDEDVWDPLTDVGDDEPGRTIVRDVIRLFVAMNLVAQQTIGIATREVPPRATRKRAHKWNPELGNKYVSLIQLRKKKAPKKDEHQTIEYSHRWIVGGHWRRQWYPKLQKHQWKYIYEYVKGPEDKPLVIREHRVFNFAR